jgi:hypothetical protein
MKGSLKFMIPLICRYNLLISLLWRQILNMNEIRSILSKKQSENSAKWRHDTRHNDIQHNDAQYNGIQHNNTQFNVAQLNDNRHNAINHNNTSA